MVFEYASRNVMYGLMNPKRVSDESFKWRLESFQKSAYNHLKKLQFYHDFHLPPKARAYKLIGDFLEDIIRFSKPQETNKFRSVNRIHKKEERSNLYYSLIGSGWSDLKTMATNLATYLEDNIMTFKDLAEKNLGLHAGDRTGKSKAVLRRLNQILSVVASEHKIGYLPSGKKINPNSTMDMMIARATGSIPLAQTKKAASQS